MVLLHSLKKCLGVTRWVISVTRKQKKRWIWRKKDSIENSDVKFLAWENDFWGTGAEIPYLWRVTTQIWIVLLIDRRSCAWKICFNQSEATNHQYGISVTVSQTTFRGETSGCIVKCRLLSSAIKCQGTCAIYVLKKMPVLNGQIYIGGRLMISICSKIKKKILANCTPTPPLAQC